MSEAIKWLDQAKVWGSLLATIVGATALLLNYISDFRLEVRTTNQSQSARIVALEKEVDRLEKAKVAHGILIRELERRNDRFVEFETKLSAVITEMAFLRETLVDIQGDLKTVLMRRSSYMPDAALHPAR